MYRYMFILFYCICVITICSVHIIYENNRKPPKNEHLLHLVLQVSQKQSPRTAIASLDKSYACLKRGQTMADANLGPFSGGKR